MGKEITQPKVNALQALASRLHVDSKELEATLKATICKEIKRNEDFITFIAVSNSYKLNPLTKEIYAFPEKKSGGIVPIVSTDGWNKLMTTHPDYERHYYVYSEIDVTMTKAKPCPEWMEIHIVKKSGGEVVVREYLDECFRDLQYVNPWQTHTKRMLRHKTKIQGAREAFGFGGIYDEDEGQRIIEAEALKPAGKPDVQEPQSISNGSSKFKQMLDMFAYAKQKLGDDDYYHILGKFNYKHANEIRSVAEGNKVLKTMKSVIEIGGPVKEAFDQNED